MKEINLDFWALAYKRAITHKWWDEEDSYYLLKLISKKGKFRWDFLRTQFSWVHTEEGDPWWRERYYDTRDQLLPLNYKKDLFHEVCKVQILLIRKYKSKNDKIVEES